MRGGPELNFKKPPVPGLLSKDVMDILGDGEASVARQALPKTD